MNMVRWSVAATKDLIYIKGYYSDGELDTAQFIIDRLVLATDWLLDWPYAGPEVAESGWRKWTPRRTSHVLIYRPIDGGIEISRVRHGRENWLADL